MRQESEMLNLIIGYAEDDQRIRAVTLNGSRVNPTAIVDRYSDFDIAYFVDDVREFTRDKSWIEVFGEVLIVQYSLDWYDNPYDYNSRDTFAYLIQFADGNRIDLTVVDISNIGKEVENIEPKKVLVNKDDFTELKDIFDASCYFITLPLHHEFYNTCNEFRWLSIYIAKGICRKEIYYVKFAYEVLMMPMMIKMLEWDVAIRNDFNITTGTHSKYLYKYLTDFELAKFHSIFPDGSYESITEKLFQVYDLFHKYEEKVAKTLDFSIDKGEKMRVLDFLNNMLSNA